MNKTNQYDGPPPCAPPSYSQVVGGVYPNYPSGSYIPSAYIPPNRPGEPPLVTTVVPLGSNSTRMICPHCGFQISTVTKTQPGLMAYISGALIALLGCWLGCCLIPCCIDECMDIHHTCPNCQAYLGRYRSSKEMRENRLCFALIFSLLTISLGLDLSGIAIIQE